MTLSPSFRLAISQGRSLVFVATMRARDLVHEHAARVKASVFDPQRSSAAVALDLWDVCSQTRLPSIFIATLPGFVTGVRIGCDRIIWVESPASFYSQFDVDGGETPVFIQAIARGGQGIEKLVFQESQL